MDDFQTIPQKIANSIIQMMKERKIHNQDRLYEQHFMKLFKVSQTVIRESFFILESKDLVIRKPRKGVFLSLPEDKDIEKLFETRELIEVFVTKVAAKEFTQEHITKLQEVMEKAEKKLSERNFAQYYVYGGAFHRKIFEFTGYTKLAKLYDNIQDIFDIFYVNKSDGIKEYEENLLEINDHRDLFNAIKARDEVKCEELVRTHIANVKNRLEGKYLIQTKRSI